MTFAGPGREVGDSGQARVVTLICPDLGARFTDQILLGDTFGGRITKVEQADVGGSSEDETRIVEQEATGGAGLESVLDAAAIEWVKNSPAIARDYAKSMIGFCTASLPVFFAVLKFVYGDTAKSVLWLVAALVTSILFLAAAVSFVVALQPKLLVIEDMDDFVTKFGRRHSTMNCWNLIGTAVFLAGVCAAVASWLLVLN